MPWGLLTEWRSWSSMEYKDFSQTPGGTITLYHHFLLQVTSSECRFILITFPPIFIDQLLRFIEINHVYLSFPITLIIGLITAHLVTAHLVFLG